MIAPPPALRLLALACSAVAALLAFAAPAGANPLVVLPPSVITLPAVSGTAVGGQTLTATTGTWTNAATYAYQWLRDGSPIPDATDSTYELGPDDVDTHVAVTVTATGPGGDTPATSAATAAVTAPAPRISGAPRIGGTAQVGQTLTADPGSWAYAASYAYQWYRGVSAIGGATSSTYLPVVADLGALISLCVSATGTGGTTTACSDGLGPVQVASPTLTAPPLVSGTAQVGHTLQATTGTWSPVPDSLSYRWLRNGAPITGATTLQHVVVAADVGAALAIEVTASNAGGSTVATSEPTGSALPAAPSVTLAPTISGAAQVGQTVRAEHGTWTDTTSYAYQWLADGQTVDGAIAADYVIDRSAIGAHLTVRVTATGLGGSTQATSTATAAVLPPAPSTTVAPSFTGTTEVGQTLAADDARTWLDATSYAYQWLRNGQAIVGAASSQYVVQVADFGAQLSMRVTATGPGGSTPATSGAQGPVTELPPANTEAPAIHGVAKVGRTLASDPGTWTDTLGFAFEWLRDGDPIGGATGASYRIAAADEGKNLSLRVTATGNGGTVAAVSNTTTVVIPATPPAVVSGPSITAAHVREATLATADPGAWDDADTFTYRWLRDGDPIAGATDPTYHFAAADVGHLVSVEVTAAGAGGTASATSDEVGPVVPLPPAPVLQTAPSIGGPAKTGYDLTAAPGTWTDTDDYDYQWQRCDAAGVNCTPLGSATSSTYTTGAGDAGHRLRVHVTANGAGGSTSADSATFGPIVLSLAPRSTKLPAVTGETQVGFTLTAATGTWANAVASYGYQWLRCDKTGKNCVPIGGATASTYTVVSGDLAGKLGVRVTATGPGGSATAESAKVGPIAAPSLPAPLGPPAVTGIAQAGWALTGTDGKWRYALGAVTYQWLRCDRATGKVCAPIAAATANTYTLTSGDLGQRIGLRVTATGPGGSKSSDSAKTAAIVTPLPPSAGHPAVSGTTQAGWTLTGATGTWRYAQTYAYQWLACDALGKSCVPIDGATASTYTLTGGELGHRVALRVTATGPGGSASSDSAAGAAIVAALAPVAGKPAVTGKALIGQTLTAATGTWRYAQSYAYQWLRCDTLGKNCVAIGGATARTYTVVLADKGFRNAVRVSGTGPGGSTTVDSAPAATIK